MNPLLTVLNADEYSQKNPTPTHTHLTTYQLAREGAPCVECAREHAQAPRGVGQHALAREALRKVQRAAPRKQPTSTVRGVAWRRVGGVRETEIEQP